MAAKLIVKPGDDISWAGKLAIVGVTDYTGYTLQSQVRQKDATTGKYGDSLGSATISAVASDGSFTYSIARSITASWPENACLSLDVRVIDPTNKYVRTETVEFKTEEGVTE